jgi:hypothetical protein
MKHRHAAPARRSRVVMTTRRAQRADTLVSHKVALTRLSKLTPLCETKVLRLLSLPRDNCKEKSTRVYSPTLHKGKPVARRGRKASGPSAHATAMCRAQDSGVAGQSFRLEACVVTPRSALPHSFRQSLLKTPMPASRSSHGACCVQTQDEEMGAAQIEKGKPVERRGRKASGLQNAGSTTAGLPIESQMRSQAAGLLSSRFCRFGRNSQRAAAASLPTHVLKVRP